MEKWFESQSRVVQIVLLFIPFVNWVVEVSVRWSHALKTKDTVKLVIAVVVTIFGVFVGWLDAIWCILYKHLFLCD